MPLDIQGASVDGPLVFSGPCAKGKSRGMKTTRRRAKAKPRAMKAKKQATKAEEVKEVRPEKGKAVKAPRSDVKPGVVGGTPMPNWADYVVTLLADGFQGFRKKTGNAREVKLSVWSDCGGMGTEVTALTHLAESVAKLIGQKLTFTNYCYCDKQKQCLQLADANHRPLHMSNDIFARDFTKNTFYCCKRKAEHEFPSKCDIYVCCFPCGPWSMTGARMGFNDRDGLIVWQAAKTINKLMPGVWYMENVMGISSSKTKDPTESDLNVITETLRQYIGSDYAIACLQQLDPTHLGFPIHRKRVVIIGIRAGFATMGGVVRNFSLLMANPMPPCLDWRVFVGRSSVPTLILNSVGDPLDESALGSCDCTCTTDPCCLCALHAIATTAR